MDTCSEMSEIYLHRRVLSRFFKTVGQSGPKFIDVWAKYTEFKQGLWNVYSLVLILVVNALL